MHSVNLQNSIISKMGWLKKQNIGRVGKSTQYSIRKRSFLEPFDNELALIYKIIVK